MRLTAYSDYALRVLIYLSIQDERLATIKEISEQYDISRNHLMKLVHDLGKHGFIETIRGKHGGLRIGRDPAMITVGEVVRAMEKDLAIVECFEPGNYKCQIVKACVLAGVIRQAFNVFLEVLDGYTISDLAKPKSQLINTFPIDVWSGMSASAVN
jgi:Rrf2 family nitric oxide-sensitive transcriptional repressor